MIARSMLGTLRQRGKGKQGVYQEYGESQTGVTAHAHERVPYVV